MALRLEDDSTHFKCGGCSNIRLIEDGHIVRVAYSAWDSYTEEKFGYTSNLIMICDKCFKGGEEDLKEGSNDGDTDTKDAKEKKSV